MISPMDVPVREIPKEKLDKILYGSGEEKIHFYYENDFGMTRDTMIQFEGVIGNVSRRFKETTSDYVREQMEKYMTEQP